MGDRCDRGHNLSRMRKDDVMLNQVARGLASENPEPSVSVYK
jgi:hypothetical protein